MREWLPRCAFRNSYVGVGERKRKRCASSRATMEQMNERRYACARSCAAERLGALVAPPLKAAKTTLAGSSDAAVRNAEQGGERVLSSLLGGVKGLII
jgi:hypothetical protein